jgi:hypothetical protein
MGVYSRLVPLWLLVLTVRNDSEYDVKVGGVLVDDVTEMALRHGHDVAR